MAQKVKKVSIPEPCHEDWGKMTPTQKGKFCGSCQKEVQDVSSFSDKKLLHFIKENENACVQMLPSQTERNLLPDKSAPLMSRAAVALGLISLTASGAAFSQERKTMGAAVYIEHVEEIEKDTVVPIKKLQGEISIVNTKKQIEITLSGVVKNGSRNGINEAVIKVNNHEKFNTNKLGKFSFKVKVNEGDKVELYFDKPGFRSEYLTIEAISKSDIEINLYPHAVKGKMKVHK